VASPTSHIHIQNPPDKPGNLRVEVDRLAAEIAKRKTLEGRFAISEDSGGDKLPDSMAPADILLILTGVPLREAKQKAPGLRWVQTTFAGVEGLVNDLPDGLKLANASGVHAEKGGEFILAAALLLAYQIPKFAADKDAQRWAPVFGPTLKQHRVTILGVGAIGGAAAEALRERGCQVTGVTRSGAAKVKLHRTADLSSLDEILAETDILVSTLPDTPESENLIDRRRIDLLPQGAGIVVVGRAAPLDYDAILDRLDAGTLRGAVLDVFPEEPIPAGDRTWTTPRLIILPHCSVDDHTTYIDRCLDIFVDNLERELTGKPLRNLVDRSGGY
jgi:phosphoglycerate dehydrogenase-like enzyme